MDDKKTMNDVLDHLISTSAKILDYRCGLAMGEDPPDGSELYNKEEQLRILDLIKPILRQTKQTQQLEARSAQDVIDLLKSGKITIEDAHLLMGLIKLKVDMEESEIKSELQRRLLDLMG